MSREKRSAGYAFRITGLCLLIFGSLHVPLPQADFHNIRHHDEPGEICDFHDHLLRWHPSADRDANVSIFHWHWFLPAGEAEHADLAEHDEQHHPSALPSLHAHYGDWFATEWPIDPVLEPDSQVRLLERLTFSLSAAPLPALSERPLSACLAATVSPADRRRNDLSGHSVRSAILQRWNC